MTQEQKTKTYSLILDFFQVTTIAYVIFSGPIFSSNLIVISLQLIALFIILWAAWEMRRTKYYRVPDTGKQNELVKTGIYKFVRNPMYLSEILFTAVLTANDFTYLRLLAVVILTVDLLLKIKYEERLLGKFFKDFAEYKKTSWRLLPFIF